MATIDSNKLKLIYELIISLYNKIEHSVEHWVGVGRQTAPESTLSVRSPSNGSLDTDIT